VEDLNYPSVGLSYPNDDTTHSSQVNRLAGAIFVVGAPAGATFSFEAVAHFECMGNGMTLTPTTNDPDAIGIALGAQPNDQVHTDQRVALAVAASAALEIARQDGRPLDLGNLLGPLAQKGAQVQKILRTMG
jgi:hypothetical protein